MALSLSTFATSVVPATALPTASSLLGARQVPADCNNGLNPGGDCWTGRDLTTFVNNWWAANQTSCASYSGFANCWYALETPYAPSTCDQLNTDPACTQPRWQDFSNDWTAGAERFYITWAIWNTQGLFLDLYNAVGDAASTLESNIGAIVTELDPPDTSTNPLEYVFDALTFGLSLYSEGSVIAKALLRSAPQSSTLANKLLFPAGSSAGEITSWAEVAQDVGNFAATWQKSIGSGLPDLVNNVTLFTSFGDSSPITGERPSLDGLTNTLSQSVGAYTISVIIQQLGWAVARAENLDVSNLQSTQGSSLAWDTGCDNGYDSNGICVGYFFDGTDTYSLINPQDMQNSQEDKIQKLIGGSNPLTTGKLLFSDGYQCTRTCGANGGCRPNLGTPGDAPTCLSTIQVCTWTWDTLGPWQAGCNSPPASDAVLPDIGVNPCQGDDSYNSWSVPQSYLGGGINRDNPPGDWQYEPLNVCNSGY
ncbi:hypothetical protein PRZ48_005205 [Zasmidium cellare]|uniref:Uncharacterized protein n=1 Tax=Zasmidium cellare TaxID=395010 RepID=A0ABR0ERQ5_ZASCE|nr:hypothetical protein PRZ48_005205 [Zasmidium cellare]